MSQHGYPYFNGLLAQLKENNAAVEKSFGKNVHWGYWETPSDATCNDEDYAVAADNLTKKLCSYANLNNHQKILDVGCGFGGTIAYLNENYSGMELTGINIDERQLERARKIVSSKNGNKITFIEGDACALPFEDNQFTHIVVVESIFHFPDRKTFFAEACRVLQPGGCIILSDFIPAPIFSPISRLLALNIIQKYSYFGSYDIQYTQKKYQKLAKELNLNMDVDDITAHTLPTYDYLCSMLKFFRKNQRKTFLINHTVKLLKFLASSRLLTYQILTFKAPSIK